MYFKRRNKDTSAAVRSSPSPSELTPRATSSHACLFSSLMAVVYLCTEKARANNYSSVLNEGFLESFSK